MYLDAKRENQIELEVLIGFLVRNKYQSFTDDESELKKYFSERNKSKVNAIIHDELKTRSRPFKTYLIDNKIYARATQSLELDYKLKKHNVTFNDFTIVDDDLYDKNFKKIKLPDKTTLIGYRG